MNVYFADTFYFLALLNPRDQAYAAVRAFNRRVGNRRIVTTMWVLVETADAIRHPRNRGLFQHLLGMLESEDQAEVVPASADGFSRGVQLFNRRQDKEWSLTDCLSFVVMRERGLTEALTGDHHFEQAGFAALLK